jgi:hypothetical protein
MGMCTFRKMASCVLLLIVPGFLSSPLLAGDTGAAMLYASGAAWLNGAHVPKSSAIFAGDMVQTRSDSAASINAPGSSITVLGDSLVKFEGTSLTVQHGGVAVTTSSSEAAIAGSVRVAPVGNTRTEFDVTDNGGLVRIAARKGDLSVTDGDGTVTLPQGQETTRNDQSKSSDGKDGGSKSDSGAHPAAGGGWLNSTVAVAVGAAAVGGVAAWVLIKSDNPVSPSAP